MRYFAYLHNEEIARKLCSFICEKSYEFYEFERSVPAACDFAGCSLRSLVESGAQAAGQTEDIWKRRGEKGKDAEVVFFLNYSISIYRTRTAIDITLYNSSATYKAYNFNFTPLISLKHAAKDQVTQDIFPICLISTDICCFQ